VEIGGYSLGQELADDPKLVELGAAEYEVLRRTFEEERIFKAGETSFLGQPANLIVGTIDGKVYKLALQFEPGSPSSGSLLLSELAHFCDGQFGTSSHGPDDATVIWDTAFGNVVLDTRSVLEQHSVTLYLTDAAITRSANPIASARDLRERFARQRQLLEFLGAPARFWTWNPLQHTDEDNLRWSWLRAVEWAHWPLFLSLPLVPLLLLVISPLALMVVLFVLDLAWMPVRYRFVSAKLSGVAAVLALARWITGPLAAIFLFRAGHWINAALALFWPLFVPLLGVPGARVGRIQVQLMRQLGYEPMPGNPLHSAPR
jgi:hypothetical protein